MPTVQVNGLTVSYIDQGEGTPVLLLHGWLANKESLAPIYQVLCQNHRCVAPDLPGFGSSDEPKEPWDAQQYADFVEAFMEKTRLVRPIGIGHSNGGRVLLKLASQKSELFSKLMMVDAAGIPAKHPPLWHVKVALFKAAKAVLTLPLIRKAGLYDKLRAGVGSEDYKNSSPVLKETMKRLLAEDLTDQLDTITVPTLLVWGEYDTATPLSDAYVMEQHIKDSGVAVIKGAGHFSFIDGAEQFRRVMLSFI